MPLVQQSVIDPDIIEGAFEIIGLFLLSFFVLNGLTVLRFFVGPNLVLKYS
jgi:hypothetical protein